MSWVETRVGDLAKVVHGFAFRGEFFTDAPTTNLLLTPGHFAIGGGFRFKSGREQYYRGPVPKDYVLSPGDLIVTMTDLSRESDTLGFPALVPEVTGVSCLHNQRLGKVVAKPGRTFDRRFLYYALCTEDYRAEVLASSTGTGVKHTAPSRIEAYQFLLPPLDEQRAIAEVLGALDDKIELNRQMNHTLEEMASALFKSWFVDFDPVVAKAEGRKPFGMDAATAALFPAAFHPDPTWGDIPKGWVTSPLDEIADYRNGLALQNFRPNPGEPRLPVIKIAQMRTGRPDSDEWSTADIDPSCILDDGDIVFSWSGSLAVVVWCGGRGALNQHLFKVTSAKFPKWFFHQWTLYHLPEFQGIAADKATTMGHIRRFHLTEARCVVPPAPVVAIADRQMALWLDLLIHNELEARTLAALRDALLPKLLSGEVRLKQAEKAVEAAL